ncbi:regulator of nucleoside diphosphate kinase [Burkholderia sp. WP9]|uniref:GreA/GreB family elongation factor n=1 Tax=Burkholderia sp. WP9 TaxID=1500263 RepID=UPI00089AC294|nr:GreA/GreB family elongation factor [Burkholderia sp. WP9]SEF13462.1 regulator of nucleoside diphosphate kinase [Burkholderia sp. WP9]
MSKSFRSFQNSTWIDSGHVLLPTVSAQQRAWVETLESTAVIVDPAEIPPHVVTMNTTVECTTVDRADAYQWTLVYPDEADYLRGRLSVLSLAGIVLLGARCGQTVVCRPPGDVPIHYFVSEILLHQAGT